MNRDGRRPSAEEPSTSQQPPFEDRRALCNLLLHPDIAEGEDRLRAAGVRGLRVGLTVAAMSGAALAPAVSLADDVPVPAPIVSPICQITDALTDGTPSGLLEDGSVCVLPAPVVPEPPVALPDAPAPVATADPLADPAPVPVEAPAAVAAAPAAVEAAPAPAVLAAETPAAAHIPATPERTRPPVVAPDTARRHADRPAPVARRHHKPAVHARPHKAAPAPTPAPALLPGLPGAPFYVTDEPIIPRYLIGLYKQAGRHYDVPWPILAAINEIETDFGRNVAVSTAGATGWMQFMPATWRTYGVDADHDGTKDPDSPRDAIFAAARYLKASGARRHMRRAIFAYNHAGWYVDSILLRAERIAQHEGEGDRRLERLFRAGERRLERQVLTDPRITLYECGRQDVAAHRIDRRVLVVLRFLAWSGLHPTVSSLECGHGVYTSSGNVSEHSTGSAVDIAAINGVPILGNQGAGSIAEATIHELLTLRGAMVPHQIISLMQFAGADNTLAMGDHADHIHVGFRPLVPLGPPSPAGPLGPPSPLLSP